VAVPTTTAASGGSRHQRVLARALPWLCAGLLAAWCYVIMVVEAESLPLGRFDDGILYTTVTYLLHGQLPITDFYEPYGIGLGVPGVLPHLFGLDSVLALRLVYGIFPAIVTLLVVPLVWRRCGAPSALLVGLMTLTSTVPRYSIGFAALFGFALIVDHAVRRTPTGTLQEAADVHPRLLLTASAVCSLAGYIRTEYAIFAALWAVVLFVALARERRRWTLSLATLLMAALPALIVTVTGGLRHLWWFVAYTFSTSESGFHAQRGQPIEWHLLGDRLNELAHLELGPSTAATIVGSYGVGLAVVIAGTAMLLVPTWRRRLLRRDGSYLTPYLILVCALVLYGQSARFSTVYGSIGNPVFWVAGALLVGRVSALALIGVIALLIYPAVPGVSPGGVYDAWKSRPPTDERVAVPGFDSIPMIEDGGPASMAALIWQWRALGLTGRATLDVELRNDLAWGNDSIVGFLLNAPPAAWPLTYDPGIVNTAKAERETVAELCHDRAPVVQDAGDYPYPPTVKVYVGSRLLDEFLAIDYEVRAVAGFYRILLPSTSTCTLPRALDDNALEALAFKRLEQGELAEAGALAIARLERAHSHDEEGSSSDSALAALGGYALAPAQAPAGPLGEALRALVPGASATKGLAVAAADPWPSDVERLAAQTAWVADRAPGEADTPQASAAVYALALRHPTWPQAIANLSVIAPGSRQLPAALARRGARGAAFDTWRRAYFLESDNSREAVAAGVALVADYDRSDDPVAAGQAQLELATYPGVSPGCALALRRSAGTRPGMRVVVPAGGPACARPGLVGLTG
jgi:hypothetical protein